MYVIAHFTTAGAPTTGLTPTLSIYRIGDSTLVVATTTMTEIGNGTYKYNFTSIAESQDYDIVIDGGAAMSTTTERYKHQIVESDHLRRITTAI